MKNNILKNIFYALPFLAIFVGCEIKEEPPLADKDKIYNSPTSKIALVNGIYEELTEFGNYKQAFFQVSTHGSGMFNSPQENFRSGVCAFNLNPSESPLYNYWNANYRMINRINTMIDDMEVLTSLDSAEVLNRDIYGNIHFVRAYQYFNLVRHFGAVPLRVATSDAENIHEGRTPTNLVYDQIIKDCNIALEYMTAEGFGQSYPVRYAANMLLSKVYMQIASAADSNDPTLAIKGYTDSGVNYWDSAYVHAREIELSSKYNMVSNYGELFSDQGNHTSESIFELNFNSETAPIGYTANFTPFAYTVGLNNYGRVTVNPELYVKHKDTYPNDPRFGIVYLGDEPFKIFWRNNTTGETNEGISQLTIDNPARLENNRAQDCYPYLKKLCLSDQYSRTTSSNKGYIIYRYADVLLMLAEIQNERGLTGEAENYLNRVLARARISSYYNNDGAEIKGDGVQPETPIGLDQEQFRERIYYERIFELLGEGEDFFEARRRGYDWMNKHVIQPHNNFKYFNPNVDSKILEGISGMLLPIPQLEINNNQKMTNADQNPLPSGGN